MCEDCGAHGHSNDAGAGHSHGHSHEHSREEGHGHSHDHPDGHGHSHDHPDGHGHSHDHGRDEYAAATDPAGTVRIAVTGKGGVGKSTLSAAIARRLAAHTDVVAIDADPDMNLATTIGVEAPPPVTAERDLIEERAGGGGLVSLTPEVADVLDSHATSFGAGGRLLTIGAPSAGNSGCMCPENSVVRSLVSTAFAEDYVVMDMEAGVEHLGRGTAGDVDAMLVVVEPSLSAIETAERIQALATDLGVEDVYAVVNRTRDNADAVRDALDIPVVATLPHDEAIATAALAGRPPVEASARLRKAADTVLDAVATDGANPEPAP